MHQIDRAVPLPSEHDDLYLFLRKTAYQQFWYQNAIPPGGSVARQYALFGSLEQNHTFRVWLHKISGLSIEQFLDLSFVVMTRVMSDRSQWIDNSWFHPLHPEISDNTVRKYLTLVSATPEQLRKHLTEFEPRGRRHYLEWYEPTPLTRFPLIHLNSRYYCYNQPLLYYSLNSFLFDILRDYDASAFMSRFGELFERYVERGLLSMNCDFDTESDLRSRLSPHNEVVDFLLRDGNTTIYVEAKGVEPGPRAMASDRSDQVFDQVKKSAIRGVVQGLKCSAAVEQLKFPHKPSSPQDNFLLVVTYKPLFLPPGNVLFQGNLRRRLESRLSGSMESYPVPANHIYFLSIQDWELLTTAVINEGVSIGGVLRDIVTADSDPNTMKFTVEQHISGMFPNLNLPPYLRDDLERGTIRLEEILRDSHG